VCGVNFKNYKITQIPLTNPSRNLQGSKLMLFSGEKAHVDSLIYCG
jgi:hypothetical protein